MKKIFAACFCSLFFLSSCGFAKENKDKMVDADYIINQINKGNSIQLSDKIITGDLDLTKIKTKTLGNGISYEHKVRSDLFFAKCVFMGKVNTYSRGKGISDYVSFAGSSSFVECDFRGDVCFNGAEFDKNLNFAKSTFRDEAEFKNIVVNGNSAQFWEIVAEKNFNIANAKIRGDINFMDAKFQKEANLSTLKAHKIQFSNVVCDEKMIISNAEFDGKANFNYCKFNNSVDFNSTKFGFSFDCNHSDFLKDLSFENCIFMGKSKFIGTNIDGKIISKDAIFFVEPIIQDFKSPEDFTINCLRQEKMTISKSAK